MTHRHLFRAAARWAAVVAVVALAAGAGWAGKEWKEIPNPDDSMFDETFQLDADARLRVEVSDVHVDLVHGEAGTAHVQVFVEGRDRDDAREAFEKLHFSAEVDDNTLKVRTHRSSFHITGFWNWSSSVRVRMIVTIPKGTDMRVSTSDGDIRAKSLTGKLDAHTSDGSILIDEVEGPSVELRTSDGNLKMGTIRADDVRARSSDGSVRAKSVEAKEVVFSTSDGDLTIEKARAESIYLRSSDGDVDVAASGGKLRAHTSDGDIRVRLDADTALDLRTSDGDIEIDAPASIGASLNLRGEHVRLTGGITIDGDVSDNRVRGTIGGGGTEIVARTSDGSISLALR
jgi:DUF4097 and DUF4098 domain-containing protein YvlB